jgi:hypothetical protein
MANRSFPEIHSILIRYTRIISRRRRRSLDSRSYLFGGANATKLLTDHGESSLVLG